MKKLIGLLTLAVVLSGMSVLAVHAKSHTVNESGFVTKSTVYLTYDTGPGPAVVINNPPTA